MASEKAERLLRVARLTGAFGVHGDVRLQAFTEDPMALADYAPLIDERGREWPLSGLRVHKAKSLTAKTPRIATREEALAAKGTDLFIPRSRLAEPEDEDEFYVEDLVGCRAVTPAGETLGRVTAVPDFGAGELLDIRGPGCPSEGLLIPFTRDCVPAVNVGEGLITVLPPAEAETDTA